MPHQSEANLPNLNRPFPPNQPKTHPEKRHSQTSEEVGDRSSREIRNLRGDQRDSLSNVKNYITRTQASRTTAIEQASDAIAYLHDPKLFEAEVFNRAAEKIGATQSVDVDFESLDVYADFEIAYPALPTAMGCLPM